jgi:hypothetical protein
MTDNIQHSKFSYHTNSCRAPALRIMGFGSHQAYSSKGEFVKPNLFVSGFFIFFLLALGTTVGGGETEAGKEPYIQYAVPATAKMDEVVARSAPT